LAAVFEDVIRIADEPLVELRDARSDAVAA